LLVCLLGSFSPFGIATLTPTARAEIITLTGGGGMVFQDGYIRIWSDQYGAFGRCGPGGALFDPELDARTGHWLCFGGLMLTNGKDFNWLVDENDWAFEGFPFPLPDENLLSDTVNDARSSRTSSFLVEFANLQVDLVQEQPSAGYNFLQTYTFTNTGGEPLSLKIVWFNDQDLTFSNQKLNSTAFLDNRVGFVPGEIPRAYFIEDSDLDGPGDPGIADRNHRISVAARMGNGVTFDGYYGAKPPGAAPRGFYAYLQSNPGIFGADLNTIQEIDGATGQPAGIDLDTDGDGLIDEPGDVAAAMQFSMDLAVGGSTSLAFDYIGGSLSHAVFDIVQDAKPLHAGDADRDLDFDQLDLVQVQVAAKYLTGQTATWGEGDWNGAPGGNAHSPPTGDGQFNQLDIVAALGAGKYLTGPYAAVASGGSRGDGQTSIIYNPTTGELAVDAPAGTQLTSINIDSAAAIFTGQSAQNLGGSFDNDSDNNLFKATFGSSFGSLSFGNVAQAGLSEQFVRSDLTVVGSLAGGGALGEVDLIYVAEPSALVLALLSALGAVTWHRRHGRIWESLVSMGK
jgi:hypothetical protein